MANLCELGTDVATVNSGIPYGRLTPPGPPADVSPHSRGSALKTPRKFFMTQSRCPCGHIDSYLPGVTAASEESELRHPARGQAILTNGKLSSVETRPDFPDEASRAFVARQ